MVQDEFQEIVNGEETYNDVADAIMARRSAVIGWSDGVGTHFDILFTVGAYQRPGNQLQGGLTGRDLFISIMRRGAFGFCLFDHHAGTTPAYYAEKLSLGNCEETNRKFAELANGVRAQLKKRFDVIAKKIEEADAKAAAAEPEKPTNESTNQ